MNTKNILSVTLISLGILVLTYSGLSFITPDELMRLVGLYFASTLNHYFSPALGALALVGGVFLLQHRPKKSV